MNEFNVKPVIVYGKDALDRLVTDTFKKVCIVTDKQIRTLGLLDLLTRQLERSGTRYEVFDAVVPDTLSPVVEQGLLHIIKGKPDAVIALGGGSSIDTAKAVIYYFHQLKETFMDKDVILKPYFVAIPTTAGTGSEVTEYAVVTDAATEKKIPITSKLMLPDLAILDPRFTVSTPDFVTADTGIDALTHAIEAYVSKGANDFSNAYALKAIQMLYQYLPLAYKDGTDLDVREKLQVASSMAGIAFNSAGLGITHSIAHAIGSKWHLPHGRTNGILLPEVMSFLLKDGETTRRYAEIARFLGLPFKEDPLAAHALIESVKLLRRSLGIPENLLEAGMDRKDLLDHLDAITESALSDLCTRTSPLLPSKQDIRGIVLQLV